MRALQFEEALCNVRELLYHNEGDAWESCHVQFSELFELHGIMLYWRGREGSSQIGSDRGDHFHLQMRSLPVRSSSKGHADVDSTSPEPINVLRHCYPLDTKIAVLVMASIRKVCASSAPACGERVKKRI